ncbi:MAG: SIS domain-containing protein [Patescibacteria group bacterium]
MVSYEKNLAEFGKQLSFKNLADFRLKKPAKTKPDGIVICGMGGSGIPGMIIKSFSEELGLLVPIVIVKDKKIPRLYLKNPFFIAVSFSGKTAETLACLKQALALKSKSGVAVVTSGGKLKSFADKRGLPLVTFRAGDLTPTPGDQVWGLTPREASGIMVHGIVKVLKAVFPLIKTSPLKGFEPLHLKGFGEQLARKAKDRNILIYTDHSFAHLGYIWKTNLNETAKIPAFTNIYPELNHNEIAGFEKAKGAWAIFWLKEKSSAVLNEKIKIISKIIGNRAKSFEVPIEGRNLQEKTWNSIVLSHWVSLYLAKLNKVDPRKTKIIDRLKK